MVEISIQGEKALSAQQKKPISIVIGAYPKRKVNPTPKPPQPSPKKKRMAKPNLILTPKSNDEDE